MSATAVNMSLDDIIKQNRLNRRGLGGRGRGGGRGAASERGGGVWKRARSRSVARARAASRSRSRSRSRGVAQRGRVGAHGARGRAGARSARGRAGARGARRPDSVALHRSRSQSRSQSQSRARSRSLARSRSRERSQSRARSQSRGRTFMFHATSFRGRGSRGRLGISTAALRSRALSGDDARLTVSVRNDLLPRGGRGVRGGGVRGFGVRGRGLGVRGRGLGVRGRGLGVRAPRLRSVLDPVLQLEIAALQRRSGAREPPPLAFRPAPAVTATTLHDRFACF